MSGEDEADFVETPGADSSEKVATESQIATRTTAKKAELEEMSEKEGNNSDKMEVDTKADENKEAELTLANLGAKNKKESSKKSSKKSVKR